MDDWIKKTEGWFDGSFARVVAFELSVCTNKKFLRFLGRSISQRLIARSYVCMEGTWRFLYGPI